MNAHTCQSNIYSQVLRIRNKGVDLKLQEVAKSLQTPLPKNAPRFQSAKTTLLPLIAFTYIRLHPITYIVTAKRHKNANSVPLLAKVVRKTMSLPPYKELQCAPRYQWENLTALSRTNSTHLLRRHMLFSNGGKTTKPLIQSQEKAARRSPP